MHGTLSECERSFESGMGNAGDLCSTASVAREIDAMLRALKERARIEPGLLLVVGASSSEMAGHAIGSAPSAELADVLADRLLDFCARERIELAAQCCEHLNRALVVSRKLADARGYRRVNARPRAKAGGSFATAVYERMKDPVLVERIEAEAGIDIGDCLVGMHLRPVAVPLRLGLDRIGAAHLLAARCRLPYIGGARTEYLEKEAR